MNSEGFRETLSEERQKEPRGDKMAENNAGREERPEERPEEEISSIEDTMDSEGTIGEVQKTEEERIARAIEGKGEFLSEELKKLLREIEAVRGLRAGALGEEIEARLRGVTEPSVEKLKEALREEMRILEERFLTRNPRSDENETSRRPNDGTPAEPGGDPGGTQRPEEAPDGGRPEGREGIYVPDVDNTLRVVPAPESKGLRSQENEAAQQFKYVDELCAELELAVLGGNTREVKCQRRALTSGLRQAKEAIVRTAEAHRWTKAALERALDDVRGRGLPQREEADHFLGEEEQEQRSKWMSKCQRMTQNAINLASQATRALTISDWSHQGPRSLGPGISRRAPERKNSGRQVGATGPGRSGTPLVRRATGPLRQLALRKERRRHGGAGGSQA